MTKTKTLYKLSLLRKNKEGVFEVVDDSTHLEQWELDRAIDLLFKQIVRENDFPVEITIEVQPNDRPS